MPGTICSSISPWHSSMPCGICAGACPTSLANLPEEPPTVASCPAVSMRVSTPARRGADVQGTTAIPWKRVAALRRVATYPETSGNFTVKQLATLREIGQSVAQGLSPNKDSEPQVLNSHDLLSHLWSDIPCEIRAQIDRNAESTVCRRYGSRHAGKVLPFAEYLEKHAEFLNRTVENRYALSGGAQWKSDHRFVMNQWFSSQTKATTTSDALMALASFWRTGGPSWSWPGAFDGRKERCEKNKDLAADREEARMLMDRAVGQMF